MENQQQASSGPDMDNAKKEVNTMVDSMKKIPSKEDIKGFDFMNLFEGRIGRRYFAYFILVNIVLNILIGILLGRALLGSLISLAIGVVGLGVTVRRLHDLGMTGWLVIVPTIAMILSVGGGMMMGSLGGTFGLMGIIGLASLLFLLYLIFTKGQQAANQYGPVPQGDRPFWNAILNLK
jgi:uncharacterized membrane protein YhaH (DUF805 family)